jgi:S-adenosylmethionine:tRNA ribosyltransferase-isomerase
MSLPSSHPAHLRISDFTYALPEERIAKFPLADRDSSKLLVCKEGKLQQDIFKNISNYVPNESILVFNSSKVIKARLHFVSPSSKQIEVFCLEPSGTIDPSEALQGQSPQRWNCLVGNLKAWKTGELKIASEGFELSAQLIQKSLNHVLIEFTWKDASRPFSEVLNLFGEVPIPPYLNRSSEGADSSSYQTVYARREGSVAAPTAGLHFTESVLKELSKKHITTQYLHLHVGAGTFKPVKSEVLQGHDMHTEWIEADAHLLETLANSGEKKVFAVGTTSLRTLESLYWMGVKTLENPQIELEDLEITQWEVYTLPDNKASLKQIFLSLLLWMKKKNLERILCRTGILIAPPYRVRVVSGLLTNFHQPQSTLLLLVSAVMGGDWKKAYAYALDNRYRFLSYGDAMLVLL